MKDINLRIKDKLQNYSEDIQALAIEALDLVDKGLSERSISEKLLSVIRKISNNEE